MSFLNPRCHTIRSIKHVYTNEVECFLDALLVSFLTLVAPLYYPTTTST